MLPTAGTLAPPSTITAVNTSTFPPLHPPGTQHTDEFFPNYFNFPKVTDSTYLRQAAEDIISILSNKHATSLHPSLSFGSPILNSYLQVAHILQLAVQTPPTPPPQTPQDLVKLPSSLPGVYKPSLLRLNPPPLTRVPATYWYPTRHTRHNQPRPAVATAAAVINTTTGDKSSLQNLRSVPEKATWEISIANNFPA